ncbi:MAG: hypothetical protein GX297_02230 [Treponema sp.]|jgi:hypothetical protein|nr:hypothetical protein [Treponema sp.]
MGDYFYKETVGPKLKGVEKAAIFLGEMDSGTASIVCGFLSTNELKKIRKALKKLGHSINIQQEIAVLTEMLKKGMLKGIVPEEALYTDTSAYTKKTYEVDQSAETVANVIASWLKNGK